MAVEYDVLLIANPCVLFAFFTKVEDFIEENGPTPEDFRKKRKFAKKEIANMQLI